MMSALDEAAAAMASADGYDMEAERMLQLSLPKIDVQAQRKVKIANAWCPLCGHKHELAPPDIAPAEGPELGAPKCAVLHCQGCDKRVEFRVCNRPDLLETLKVMRDMLDPEMPRHMIKACREEAIRAIAKAEA